MTEFKNNYDLEQRTLDFSKSLIKLLKRVPKNQTIIPLLDQCLRSGTSIGANYREANGASSKKDFRNKIAICKKEAKETLYWLELIATVIEDIKEKELVQKLRYLWSESKEYVLIFGKILGSTK